MTHNFPSNSVLKRTPKERKNAMRKTTMREFYFIF